MITVTYPDAKIRLLSSNIKHITTMTTFPQVPMQQLFRVNSLFFFWKSQTSCNRSYSSYHAVHSLKQIVLKGCWYSKILDISKPLGIDALRRIKDTGKQLFLSFFFACILVMSLDKNTCFLRFRLPVLLQQNLRCKVWDDTAKIKYIALFAISEQCSHWLFWS